MDQFPNDILDTLVAEILRATPSLRLAFLASLGTRISASTMRVSFKTVVVLDKQSSFNIVSPTVVASIFSHPEACARLVKRLVIKDASTCEDEWTSENQSTIITEDSPVEMHSLCSLLEACSDLEHFLWESCSLPPDGICEVLRTHNLRLIKFHYAPPAISYTKINVPSKWDAPSVPILSSLSLSSLHVSHVSQSGARALATLLSSIADDSLLEDISLNFIWLDDGLCQKIADAGRRLRKLILGTTGTKLTDRGVCAILEGCNTLEDLTLQGVQGRLSRTVWSKPARYPSTLKTFRIKINETGPHHSWSTDHLSSLHCLPFHTITSLSVLRIPSLPRIRHGVAVFDKPIDEIAVSKSLPSELVNKIKSAGNLEILECDWWTWGIAHLKSVLENCPKLQSLRISLDAPFPKLLSLTSSFAAVPSLWKLAVSVSPTLAPGRPPMPLLPSAKSPPPTPRESPVMKSKSVLPQLLDFDQMQTQTCVSKLDEGDPSMPPTRDVRRFVRKCPHLSLLVWYGNNGRGSWTVTRPSHSASKISMNVHVEHHPPIISESAYRQILLNQAIEEGRVPLRGERVGQTWVAANAEALTAEQLGLPDGGEDQGSPVSDKENQYQNRHHLSKAKQRQGQRNEQPEGNILLLTPSTSTGSCAALPPTPVLDVRESSLACLSGIAIPHSSGSPGDYQALHRRRPSEPNPSGRQLRSRSQRARSVSTTLELEQSNVKNGVGKAQAFQGVSSSKSMAGRKCNANSSAASTVPRDQPAKIKHAPRTAMKSREDHQIKNDKA